MNVIPEDKNDILFIAEMCVATAALITGSVVAVNSFCYFSLNVTES